jgi:thiol-disulfide isomerase/thioredoxin/outer membrane lipoprotein-sorting protein
MDIDGQIKRDHNEFNGSIAGGGKFRNEMKGDTVVGSTGEKVYVFLTAVNRYQMSDVPAEGVNLDSIDGDTADLIREQDLSLALALAPDLVKELSTDAVSIEKAPDVTMDKTVYPAIHIAREANDVVLAFDPQTHFLSRETVDLTKSATKNGAKVVKSALYTMYFTNTIPASVDAQQFAWAPPAGAQEMGHSTASIEGQPAPAFELSELDGTPIQSKSLKGTIYILDFWATWCGPCVASLPHLDDLNTEYGPQGVKMFAVNEQEDKAVVKKFVDDKKLKIAVLLDTDGKVGQAYGADAIPLTVLVGKDGKVRKTFLGMGHEDEIKRELQTAMQDK